MTTLKNWILYGLLFSLPVACAGPATPAPTATPAPLLPTPTRTVPPPTPVPTPTPTPVPISFSSIDMIDETGGWAWAAGTDDSNSLLRTQDGGQTWMDVTPRELMTLNRYGSIALNDQLAWVQFFDAGINTNGLARTTDGGTTWTVQNGSLPFPSANFHFTDPSNGWAETVDVGAGNAYVQVRETHDGGKTWELVPILSPSRDPRLPAGTLHLCNICGDGFYYDPVRVVITYGDLAAAPGGAVRLAVSTDLGETWQNLKLALPTVQYQDDQIVPLAPIFFDRDHGVLPVVMQNIDPRTPMSSLAVYGTQDGGRTWKVSPVIIDDVDAFPAVDFVTPQDAFMVCRDNLCVTHDGAQNWETLTSNLVFDSSAPTGEHISHFDFVNIQAGWAITTNAAGSTSTLWKTNDGGRTWRKLSPSMAK